MATKKANKKKNTKGFPTDLYKRARRAGMGEEQIASFATAEDLKAKCDRISPNTNPDSKVKKGVVKKGTHVKVDMADVFEVDSSMEASKYASRMHFDNGNLQAELRRVNRIYGTHIPVRILMDQSNKPVQGKNKLGQNAKMMVTHFTIYYKEVSVSADISELVMQAVGEASGCWSTLDGAGVFDSTRAKKIGDKLIKDLSK